MKHCGRAKVMLFSFFFLFMTTPLFAADYQIRLEADSGFHQRENELVKVELEFKRGVNKASFLLMELVAGEKKEIPFYFIPKDKHQGELYWILSGATEAFSRRSYYLHFSAGAWSKEAFGSPKVANLVRERGNLIPNYSFESAKRAEVKSNWQGSRKPLAWNLNDYAWADRALPNLKSRCRLSEKEAYTGTKSLKIVAEVREGKNVTGFAQSSIFPLKPNTKYDLSYHFKITRREDNRNRYQAINVQVHFLNEHKNRVHPGDTARNRLLLGYLTTRHPKEDYLDKWVKIEGAGVTPPEVRYGSVNISSWFFSGTFYIDNLILSEIREGDPIQVEVGNIEKKR